MARIRTVKPEFWTDEKVVECSIPARLLFIGLFNFANDKGCLERSPKRIKMQVFPADVIDCEPLIGELITHGLLMEYTVSGNRYLQIKGFSKHQKINRPSVSKIPVPDEFSEPGTPSPPHSLPVQQQLTEDPVNDHDVCSDGGEREGKGKGKHSEREYREARQSPGDNVETPFCARMGKFAITANWQPGKDFVRQAALWGIQLGSEPGYRPEELQQFRDYWGCEDRVKHQQQWEQTFAQSLRSSRNAVNTFDNPRRGTAFAISEPDTQIPPGFRG